MAEGRLAGAAVAVDHHVAADGDERIVAGADDRIGARLVHGGELARVTTLIIGL